VKWVDAPLCAVDHGFLCGTGSLIVRPGPSLSSKFLGRLLSSRDMVRTMERASLGTTMPNLNQAIVANLHFPLPPLTEQRRIAAILDQADEVRSQKRRLRSAVGALGMSIFADMFGTARATTTLGECGEVQGGLQVSAKRVGLALELPYLRVANVYRGRLDLAEVRTIRAREAEAARTRTRGPPCRRRSRQSQ
jgi:type I restriction enzyme, S subunit